MQNKNYLKLRLIFLSVFLWIIGGLLMSGYFYYSWHDSVTKQEVMMRQFAAEKGIPYQPAEYKYELGFTFAPEPFRTKLLEVQNNIGGSATTTIFALVLSILAGITTGWKIGSQIYK